MKLYKVSVFDTEHGRHLINEILFENAKDARQEYLKTCKEYGFVEDTEWQYRGVNHCHTYDYDIYLKVINTGEWQVKWYPNKETQEKRPYFMHECNVEELGDISVEWILEKALEDVNLWYYKRGFKYIYDTITMYVSVPVPKYENKCMYYTFETKDCGECIVKIYTENYEYKYEIVK